MKRKLMLVLFAVPVLAVTLAGCIVEERGGYYGHPHYYHDRW